MNKLQIFTDGAYSPNRDCGGWAFYIPELNIKVCNQEFKTTNNRMELMAVIKALEFIMDSNLEYSFEIFSDSMYVVGGINLHWSKNANSDLWEKLDFYLDLLADKNITFSHIKGHAGNSNNETADLLAVLGYNFKKNGCN